MKHLVSINPATEAQIALYDCMDDRTLAVHLDRSHVAYASWRRTALDERIKAVRALGSLLIKNKDTLAKLATAEMGKPLAQAIKEVEKCTTACSYYADEAPNILQQEHIETNWRKSFISYQPLGTILCVMPWNFPYWQVVRFAIPAMLVGNTVVLKHAETTTGSALLLGNLMRQAGFPEDVFKPVIAHHEQVESMIKHPAVRAVSLTGSERAGVAVASAAGSVLKKSVLELGGSDPYIVLADADVDQAASICVDARLINNGQSCIAAKRFIVESPVYERFIEAFTTKIRAKTLGDPMHPATDIGPLAKLSALEGLEKQVATTLEQGARLVYGGKRANSPRSDGKGYYYEPTVLADVVPGMVAFDEETFGPVAAIVKASSTEDAFKLANHSSFGLGGAVFSRDLAKAEQLAEQHLEAGYCAVNTNVVSDARLPFGGVKNSGYGRELAHVGMREFMNIKTVVIA